MNLQIKLLISYGIILVVVLAGIGIIDNIKKYLQVSIPILILIGIFLGIYIYLERQKNTEDNSKNKKKHS